MQPIRNNVLVKPYSPNDMSEGGLFIPESVQQVNNKVLVVKVGNGTPKRPMTLKEGQTGFRVKGWGEEVEFNGEPHYIMDASAILAIQ